MSVKYGGLLNNAAGTRSYTAIAVGRVMTCVLGMVVIREREIRNFKETRFTVLSEISQMHMSRASGKPSRDQGTLHRRFCIRKTDFGKRRMHWH